MRATAGPGTAADGSLQPDRRSPTFQRDVQRMFATIVRHYDTVNHLATFGQDLLWRPWALWELRRFSVGPVRRVLDVGCGTGALARLFVVRYPGAQVVASDFTVAMVRRAQARRGRTAVQPSFAVANISRLPFADGAFDVAASAFVARNLSDLAGSFRELRRVLRPRGTLLTLEITEPTSPTVRRLFHAHFDHALPILGRAFGREGPYSYLPESLRHFPSSERLVTTLVEAGFPRTEAYPMSRGIVTAYLSEASREPPPRS